MEPLDEGGGGGAGVQPRLDGCTHPRRTFSKIRPVNSFSVSDLRDAFWGFSRVWSCAARAATDRQWRRRLGAAGGSGGGSARRAAPHALAHLIVPPGLLDGEEEALKRPAEGEDAE